MTRKNAPSTEDRKASAWKPQEYQGDLHAKDRLLTSVHKISNLLTRPVSLDTVLTAIVEETAHVFGYDRVAIYLVSKDGKLLECKYEIGFTPEEMEIAFQRPFSLERHECIETLVVKTGENVYIRDYNADSRVTYLDRKVSAKQNRFATIAVPLRLRESVIGLIEADRGGYPLVLTEEDIQHLSIFANQASIIIENTRLYEQLVNERNFAENVVQSSPNCILVVNCDGTIRTVNPMTQSIFGLAPEKVIGRMAADVFDDPLGKIIRDALAGQMSDSHEIVIKRKGGARTVLDVSTSQLKSQDGTVLGAVLIATDLTEVKKTDEWMRRVDRLSSLGQLSAGVAHEIRNPLASINFNIQLLSKRVPLDEKSRRIVENSLAGVDRIKGLVKGMLDFSRPAPPQLKKESIHRALEDAVALMDSQFAKHGIRVVMNLADEVPDIVFDNRQIQQVFVNMLLNAMQAMPEGGTVTIETRVGGETKELSRYLSVYISDTGIGIPRENFSKIFDPFFTTKPEGTGLGLSIAHKILEQHGALMEIRSRIGQGTMFIVRFPIQGVEAHVPV
ncbi:MAG: ATP-binding protein [Syntrophales bacterium]|nr:ATP-binding protein [Syntrophales bacterium]MCU0584068.1 ATP-binding protein [Syntrophales bacterium]